MLPHAHVAMFCLNSDQSIPDLEEVLDDSSLPLHTTIAQLTSQQVSFFVMCVLVYMYVVL